MIKYADVRRPRQSRQAMTVKPRRLYLPTYTTTGENLTRGHPIDCLSCASHMKHEHSHKRSSACVPRKHKWHLCSRPPHLRSVPRVRIRLTIEASASGCTSFCSSSFTSASWTASRPQSRAIPSCSRTAHPLMVSSACAYRPVQPQASSGWVLLVLFKRTPGHASPLLYNTPQEKLRSWAWGRGQPAPSTTACDGTGASVIPGR